MPSPPLVSTFLPPPQFASKPSSSLLAMKYRPPSSSYGDVCVPPHHRLRSVIVTPSYTSAASIGPKQSAAAALNRKTTATNGVVAYYPAQQQDQGQKPKLQHNSSFDDPVSEDGSDREVTEGVSGGKKSLKNLDQYANDGAPCAMLHVLSNPHPLGM